MYFGISKMLNELLPENMRQVMEFASTHPVASIIEAYHDEKRKKKEKEMNEKEMNEAREWMNESKLNLENFKNYLHKRQDKLWNEKDLLEKQCKVCETCIDIMSKHDCESVYDTCYCAEYGINIASSCWDCFGCHYQKIINIKIELESLSEDLRNHKDQVESAAWQFNYACAVFEGRRSKFLRHNINSDIESW
jgi:hypothetical protein